MSVAAPSATRQKAGAGRPQLPSKPWPPWRGSGLPGLRHSASPSPRRRACRQSPSRPPARGTPYSTPPRAARRAGRTCPSPSRQPRSSRSAQCARPVPPCPAPSRRQTCRALAASIPCIGSFHSGKRLTSILVSHLTCRGPGWWSASETSANGPSPSRSGWPSRSVGHQYLSAHRGVEQFPPGEHREVAVASRSPRRRSGAGHAASRGGCPLPRARRRGARRRIAARSAAPRFRCRADPST